MRNDTTIIMARLGALLRQRLDGSMAPDPSPYLESLLARLDGNSPIEHDHSTDHGPSASA
jgi:hypothetical protein